MRQVHFAFRPDGDRFTGGHATYAVSAGADGLSFTPARPGAPSGAPAVAPLVASVSAFERGGAPLPGTAPLARLGKDATLSIDRGAAVEHLENTDEGVEQSFRFAERPAGSGDLVVRLRVSGEAFVGATDGGLHFADAAAGAGVRYGTATWVDAHGQRTAAPVGYQDGAITITVPAAAVEDAAYPAVLDPVIGPEIGVDKPVIASPPVAQVTPDVAYGNGAYLAVWSDARIGSNGANIFAVRISSAGAVLDPTGIAISTALTITETAPSVAWNGSEWMVVWLASGGTYGARVSSAGTVLDTTSISVGLGGGRPGIAAGGSTFAVSTYDATFSPYSLDVSLINANGVRFSVQQLNANMIVSQARVVYSGGNFYVVFGMFGGLYYQRVTPTGTVLDASPVKLDNVSTSPTGLQLAAGPSTWIATYRGTVSSTPYVFWTIFGVGSGSTKVVNTAAVTGNVATAAVGNDFGVFWEDGGRLSAIELDATGAILSVATGLTGPGSVSTTSSDQMSASSDGTNFFVAYTNTTAYGLRLTPALSPLDAAPIPLARSANAEISPSVAWNGADWLVAWQDARSGASTGVYAARVDPTGTMLDPGGIALTNTATPQVAPSVASNGAGWFVAWQDARNAAADVYGTRVAANGAVQDPSGVPISVAKGVAQFPAVASDGADYLVAWYDQTSTTIQGARVGAAGTLLDAVGGFQVGAAVAGPPYAGPAVGYNGTSYLVAWPNGPYAARVTPAGAVLDATRIKVGPGVAPCQPSVASDGTNWLVVWTSQYGSVNGARISGSGMVLDSPGFLIAGGLPSWAFGSNYVQTAAWDGNQYWVAWQTGITPDNSSLIYANRVSAGGTRSDAAGFLISSTQTIQIGPSAAGGAKGELALFYTTFDFASGANEYRITGSIIGTLDPPGAACTYGAECQSGFCADGVCCDAACTGTCVACTATKKGSGKDGTCGPIAAATDPDNECAMQAQSTCGTTGTCDGKGACAVYAAGLSCPATCASGAAQQNACNGMGACAPSAAPQSCGPYACAAGACKTTCATSADCVPGGMCVGTTCVAPAANGAACSVASDCQSGFCVDGVCCNNACTGLCAACSAAKKGQGADGTCGPVAAGLNPDGDCTASAQSTCGESGACNGGGACQLWPYGTTCAAGTCVGDTLVGMICNGQGGCVLNPSAPSCAPYACSAGACGTSCSTSADCASGYVCNQGACQTSGAASSSSSSSSSSSASSSSSSGGAMACTTGTQCTSGFCVDGVCCDAACTGSCVACSAAKKGQGADGTCGPVVAGTDPDNDCAIQVPSTCQQNGQCDGNGACQLWPTGTVCAAASCNGSMQVSASTCDGLGACHPGASQSCTTGYVCSGTTCAMGCTDDSSCAPGYTCDAAFGACAPAPDAGLADGGSDAGPTDGGAGGGSTSVGTGGAGTGGSTSSGTGGAGTGGSTSAGTGGAGTSTGGSASATGGGGTGPKKSAAKSGCGCIVAGEPTTTPYGAAFAIALVALRSGRRRRRQR